MPHLDEGTLQAYLDDQHAGPDTETAEVSRDRIELHLSECAECRVALENARHVKTAADDILAMAGPKEVQMPSFAELQARADSANYRVEQQSGRSTAVRRGGLSQMRALAWAATIVLAAAVGWYARSAVLSSRQDGVVSEDETSGRLMQQVPQTDSAGQDETSESATRLTETTNQEEIPEDLREEQLLNIDEVQTDQAQTAVPSEPDETISEREEPAAAPRVGAVQAPAAVSAPTDVSANPGAAAGADVSLQERRDAPESARVRRAAAEQAAPAPMLMAVSGKGAGSGIAWTIVDAPTAEDILDRSVPAIEGLSVLEYATTTLDGREVVRLTQELASGSVIHLTITTGEVPDELAESKRGLEGAALSVDANTPPTNNILVRRGDLSILLDAALSLDSLRVLGEKITS